MLAIRITQGAADACAKFGLKLADVHGPAVPVAPHPVPAAAGAAAAAPTTPGLMDRAKSFGMGQVDAGKSLFHNLRGGLGGAYNPHVTGEGWKAPQGFDEGLGRAMHRDQALGNLKTLAPTLLAGGGAYLLHKRHQNQMQEEQAQQHAMMQQQGYGGPPPM